MCYVTSLSHLLLEPFWAALNGSGGEREVQLPWHLVASAILPTAAPPTITALLPRTSLKGQKSNVCQAAITSTIFTKLKTDRYFRQMRTYLGELSISERTGCCVQIAGDGFASTPRTETYSRDR